MRGHSWSPEPPVALPPARTVIVPGRGEFFLRDTGGDGPVVMLLHGWMVSGDLNWHGAYDDLVGAGYRVLAIDHRGHGRGLRPLVPFRLTDCANDVAAVLRELDAAPALVAGYSMGGAIAQLVAYEHPDVVKGVVLGGTAQHWQDPRTQRAFKAMGLMGFAISVAPRISMRIGFRRVGWRLSRQTAWIHSELMRNSPRDIAEAGRELGRFDSRTWLGSVRCPMAVLVMTRDELVPPSKQHKLAQAAGGPRFEVPLTHLALTDRRKEFNMALLQALEAVAGEQRAPEAEHRDGAAEQTRAA